MNITQTQMPNVINLWPEPPCRIWGDQIIHIQQPDEDNRSFLENTITIPKNHLAVLIQKLQTIQRKANGEKL